MFLYKIFTCGSNLGARVIIMYLNPVTEQISSQVGLEQHFWCFSFLSPPLGFGGLWSLWQAKDSCNFCPHSFMKYGQSFLISRILADSFFFFFYFYFIFKLYIIVLVLPNIKMNPPQVYMCWLTLNKQITLRKKHSKF